MRIHLLFVESSNCIVAIVKGYKRLNFLEDRVGTVNARK